MEEVTLWQILQAREERAERQRALLETYRRPLICFTMNIPGPVKDSPLIRRAFLWGCGQLEARLPGLLHREVRIERTGCEGYFVAEGDALTVKAVCAALEEETPLGRLFDMDVLDGSGRKLDRSEVGLGERGCLVCGAPGRGCAARRLHSVVQLQQAVRSILEAHFREEDPKSFADLAVRSLLREVETTPKPGLVDRRNSGSHTDMDIHTFYASAEALRGYFHTCVELGRDTASLLPGQTFAALRKAGLQAEEIMYRATGGVNTHKGAIFTLGLLCGGLGRLWRAEVPVPELSDLLRETASLASCSLRDLEESPATHGQRLYRQLGLTGIRGEAAAGFPSLENIALPVLRACREEGNSENDAGVIALLHLMAHVEDTNLYHRGGPEGAAWAKETVRKLLPRPDIRAVEALDDAFIQRNLSPGGCADLLAAACFLDSLIIGRGDL